MKQDRPKQARYRLSVKGRFTDSKAEARRRGVSWTLSLEDFRKMLAILHCHYCKTFALLKTKSGLDRLNPSLGYSLTNVVRCCHPCNTTKRRKSHDDFCKACDQVLDRGMVAPKVEPSL